MSHADAIVETGFAFLRAVADRRRAGRDGSCQPALSATGRAAPVPTGPHPKEPAMYRRKWLLAACVVASACLAGSVAADNLAACRAGKGNSEAVVAACSAA